VFRFEGVVLQPALFAAGPLPAVWAIVSVSVLACRYGVARRMVGACSEECCRRIVGGREV